MDNATAIDQPEQTPAQDAAPKTRKPHVRLTDDQKALVREMLAKGAMQTDVAKVFGVTPVTISNIHRNYQTLKPRAKNVDTKPFVG